MSPKDHEPRRRLVPEGIGERFATVGGHRMRYLTGGNGPPLLLVHGLMGFSFSFSENLTALSNQFTVFAPDLLNAGYSDRTDFSGDLSESVKQVADFMDAVSITRADVVGSSYGGTLVMALAARDPARVKTVVPVAPAHCASEHGRWQVALFASPIGLWVAKVIQAAPPLLHAFFIKRMYGDASRALPGTVTEYARAIEIRGTTVAAARVMKNWTRNFEQFCAMMPSLVHTRMHFIWGDKDPVVPVRTSRELLQEFPSATLSIIKSAGHLPYEELPSEFNKVLLDILLDKTDARY